jgi:bifunctional non-homologous end joining protein LigD
LLVDEAPRGAQWIHELKLDGYRIGLFKTARDIALISRRGIDYSADFAKIVAAARKLAAKTAIIDGEVVVLDARGVSSFQALQQRGSARHDATYFAFDLLAIDGLDLTALPLEERKSRLRKLVGDKAGVIRYTQHVEGSGEAFFQGACAAGAEGIISKRRDGRYRIDSRHPDWQKTKCVKRQELVVGGFTEPEGSRVGIGSVLVGYYEGERLVFAGKVGTGRGWTESFGRALRKQLEALEVKTPPFDPAPRGAMVRRAHWVRPKLVVEVAFTEWTADGRIRHPSLQGIRTDKKARDVVREREVRLRGARGASERE